MDARKTRGLVVAMIAIATALRPGIASIGPVLPALSREFSLSHATASLLTAIPALLMGWLALPTPWLARRVGRSQVLVGALVLLFVSMTARPFVTTVPGLLLATAGVGAGIAVAGTLFAGIIKARFPSRLATMMSIYATSLAFSTTVSAAATGPIAAFADASGWSGWRVGTGLWSPVALLAIAAAVGILVRERREPATVASKPVDAGRLPLGNATAWRVALFFACNNFLFFSLLAWTSPIYLERGLSTASAGVMLGTFMAAFTVAIPAMGASSRSRDRRAWLAACTALTLLGVLGMAWARSPWPHAWVAIAALGLGGGFTLGMTLPLDSARGPDEANAWNAFMMTVGYLLAATGPLLVGALRDATGGFGACLWLLFAVAVAMLALTPYLAPHRHEVATS